MKSLMWNTIYEPKSPSKCRIVAKVDETQLYRAQRLLNRELKLALDAGGIEIPFTQVVVHQAND